MKNSFKLIVILCALLCVESIDANAQFILFGKKRKQTLAEMESLKRDNAALQQHMDSLSAVIRVHEATIDSLSNISTRNEFYADSVNLFINDSLLHEWHIMQNAYSFTGYDMDKEHFTSDVPDEVFIRRLSEINSFIPLPFNDIVKNYCILYSEKTKTRMGKVLGDCQYYWPIFDEILLHYDMPLELKALVIVESMMEPTATSRVGAKGLWQFMYGTAKGYGMRMDSFMDERMDPVVSTNAAARYLKDAYRIFGDWALAIASYNCGAGNVNKAIRRSGGKRDFWQIYDYLPRETRGYVPAFIGALYATHYYKEYGIQPQSSVISVPVDTFMINRNLHFAQLNEVLGVPMDVIEGLNPMYMHKIIPGDSHRCLLRLPMQYSAAFIDSRDSLYSHRKDSLLDPVQIKKVQDGAVGSGNRIVYKVKSGDVLGRIANRYGVTVAQIKKWNSLKSNNLRIGQKLVIYSRKA